MSNALTYLNSAIKAHASGSLEEARYFYKKTLIEDPQNSTALGWLGSIEAQLKNHDIAEDLLKKALAKEKNNQHFLLNYANLLYEKRQFYDAVAFYQKAIRQRPSDPICFANLAACYNEQGQPLLGLRVSDQAIQLKPDYAEAWSNRGNALHELKRYDEAIASHERALELKPDYAEAWSNRGNALNDLKRYDEAIAHYDQAISLKPDYAEGWSNKGATLHQLKRYDEAITHYDKAITIKPNIDWVYGNLIYGKMQICNWSTLGEDLENITQKVMSEEKVVNPLMLLAMNDDAFLHKKCSEIYAQNMYPLNSTLGSIPKSAKKERIRIAYFSPDFRNHPVSFLTSELFEIHDRDRFEVFAFSLNLAPTGDEMNLRLRKSFDRFIDADNMSDREVAELARELEIDIAIDLAGPTQYSRTGIFSYRAAPIQVNWLGYPGTIGAKYIDYIVADKIIIPEPHQQFYAEKIVYLPNTYMVDDTKRIPSTRVFTREECGLQENAFVFCCFNNDYKFNPKVLDGWSRILLAAKNSVLWISENNKYFRANIATEFESRGIDSDRIIFAQKVEMMADHLSRYALADLFLDTHPYNAHTTALDSLKAGVPILTLMGQSFASRVAASLLNAIGLPELITNTQEEYEALAIELAMNPQKLADIKLKLAHTRLTTPLFDTPLFTKNLEGAYLKMMERYQADMMPDHIFIV
jgi:predicted O-linked N-acetylglucosamine transferase (SPINDLY family)